MKDGLIELQQKGASLRVIRELLATVDVAVGTATIARFLAEVDGETTPQHSSKRSRRRRVAIPKLTSRQPGAALAIVESSAPARPQPAELSPERPRARGPRVADPRNL